MVGPLGAATAVFFARKKLSHSFFPWRDTCFSRPRVSSGEVEINAKATTAPAAACYAWWRLAGIDCAMAWANVELKCGR